MGKHFHSVHEELMAMTAKLPMRTIEINGQPYLQRYFVGQESNGVQIWFHRFLRGDPDRFFHSHPWRAISTMLCGQYHEIRLVDGKQQEAIVRAGYVNEINYDTLHKVINVRPDTWTTLVVFPDWQPWWKFIDSYGDEVNMLKTHNHAQPWWEGLGTREDYESKIETIQHTDCPDRG